MLKFIYGVMGSSKSAQALITEYNYRQNGFDTVIIKPALDTRSKYLKSRIGLKAKCYSFSKNDNIRDLHIMPNKPKFNKLILIVDEVQFCTKEQIEQLKEISEYIDVFCYGLLTNFKSELFEGSKRLVEIADELERIPHICECGQQAQINALFEDKKLITDGAEIRIGDQEYKPMCYKCYRRYKNGSKTY